MKTKRAPKLKGIGWDVFSSIGSSDGDMQICRVDCPEDDTDQDYTVAFADDREAIEHVIRRARQGDEQAIDALWEVLDADGLVNRVLWCEAMGWKGKNDANFEGA